MFAMLTYPFCVTEKQIEGGKSFVEALNGLVQLFDRAEREGYTAYGLWFERGSLSYADVMAAPCKCFHRIPVGYHASYY